MVDDTNNSHINSEQDEPDVDRFILNMAHAALVWAHKKTWCTNNNGSATKDGSYSTNGE